jgi:hypothetical protein
MPAAAQALTLVAESVTVDASGAAPVTSSFVLFIELGEGESPPQIAAFTGAVDLGLPGMWVSFVAPFAELTSAASAHPPLITQNFSVAADAGAARAKADAFLASGSTPALDGLALFQVPFQVSPGTRGVFPVVFDLDEFAGTLLVDGEGNAVPFETVNGAITVVPEPSTLSLVGLGATLLVCMSRRRV